MDLVLVLSGVLGNVSLTTSRPCSFENLSLNIENRVDLEALSSVFDQLLVCFDS